MAKPIALIFASVFLSLISLAQVFQKEFRISTGLGLSNSLRNSKSAGIDCWVQFDYKLSNKFSLASEFENMFYKQPGYFLTIPFYPNEIKVVDNNYSILVKYHFPAKKLNLSFASGWTFCVRQNQYYSYQTDGITQHYFPNTSTFSDYRIPFLAEAGYPLSKNLNIEARLKYNLMPQDGNTYATGIGLSLKL